MLQGDLVHFAGVLSITFGDTHELANSSSHSLMGQFGPLFSRDINEGGEALRGKVQPTPQTHHNPAVFLFDI